MRGETGERWRDLCAQAAVEQDPERLIALIQQINQLLEQKEQRLNQQSHRQHNAPTKLSRVSHATSFSPAS
jgi:hypothetical protein